jgi:hypothetical protein
MMGENGGIRDYSKRMYRHLIEGLRSGKLAMKVFP